MQKKLPFSKLIVLLVIIISTSFICWCCYEMHRLDNLEPIGFIGGGVVALLATVVAAYMSRAKKQGEFDLQLAKIEKVVELQEKHPDMDISQLVNDNNGYYSYGGYGGYEDNTEGY